MKRHRIIYVLFVVVAALGCNKNHRNLRIYTGTIFHIKEILKQSWNLSSSHYKACQDNLLKIWQFLRDNRKDLTAIESYADSIYKEIPIELNERDFVSLPNHRHIKNIKPLSIYSGFVFHVKDMERDTQKLSPLHYYIYKKEALDTLFCELLREYKDDLTEITNIIDIIHRQIDRFIKDAITANHQNIDHLATQELLEYADPILWQLTQQIEDPSITVEELWMAYFIHKT